MMQKDILSGYAEWLVDLAGEEIEGEEEGLLNELNQSNPAVVPPTIVVHSKKLSCTKVRVTNVSQTNNQCRSPVEELARRFQIPGKNDEEGNV